MEEVLARIAQLDPFWVYVTIVAFAYLENILPPLPSDFVIVAAGSFAGVGKIDFSLALILASTASTLGFMTMYKVGDWFGDRIVESGRIPFIPLDQLHRAEGWFKRYGAWVVVANRFLAGTRAIVAFFVGMSELPFGKTVALSFLSSAAWNFVLLYGGRELGENWREIFVYLRSYGTVITLSVVALAIGLIIRSYRKTQNKQIPPPVAGSDGGKL